MPVLQLVQAAVEARAAADCLPGSLLAGLLSIYLNLKLLNLCLPDLRAERKLKALRLRVAGATAAMVAVSLLLAWGGKQAQTRQTRAAAAVVPAVCAAFEAPVWNQSLLTYRTAADAAELVNLGAADSKAFGPANLPMSLVADLERSLSGQPLRYLPPAPSPLKLRLQSVLEHWYVRPARQQFWFGLAFAAAWFAFALHRAASPGRADTPLFPASVAALFLVAAILHPRKLDAEYRSATACEPVAAALARAYTRPTECRFTEFRSLGPEGRRLTVRAHGGPTYGFLGRLGTVVVEADLREPLIRELDAAAAEFGYAPLNSKPK